MLPKGFSLFQLLMCLALLEKSKIPITIQIIYKICNIYIYTYLSLSLSLYIYIYIYILYILHILSCTGEANKTSAKHLQTKINTKLIQKINTKIQCTFCYGSIPWALGLIGSDGGLSTLVS